MSDSSQDYFSARVSERVSQLIAAPALLDATRKITERFPHSNFTRINDHLYHLDGFVFVDGGTYKVSLESGQDGTVFVSVTKVNGRLESVDHIVASLDSDFPAQFPDLVAEVIVKLQTLKW